MKQSIKNILKNYIQEAENDNPMNRYGVDIQDLRIGDFNNEIYANVVQKVVSELMLDDYEVEEEKFKPILKNLTHLARAGFKDEKEAEKFLPNLPEYKIFLKKLTDEIFSQIDIDEYIKQIPLNAYKSALNQYKIHLLSTNHRSKSYEDKVELINDALKAKTPEQFTKIIQRTDDDNNPILLKDIDRAVVTLLRKIPIINLLINRWFPVQPQLKEFEKNLLEKYQSEKFQDSSQSQLSEKREESFRSQK